MDNQLKHYTDKLAYEIDSWSCYLISFRILSSFPSICSSLPLKA
jgi:hypothetical protein